MNRIPLVDLKAQYADIKQDINAAILNVLENTNFIQGNEVSLFEAELAEYLSVKHVISCANGTDALQVALMALNLEAGSEVLTSAFSYIAVAEVCSILGLKIKLVDVDMHSYNLSVEDLEAKISPETMCVIPVHLFGQSCNMAPILELSKKHNAALIEDNAQSIGASYCHSSIAGKTGSFGMMGTLSFFPSKNLGCYGDGGAIMTNDTKLAKRLKMISMHGQSQKYHHDILGLNSRLDTVQAAILSVKLKKLDSYKKARQNAASLYNERLKNINNVILPEVDAHCDHVYHQYTIRIKGNRRDELKSFLEKKGIASSIYYPLPVYRQKAYQHLFPKNFTLPNTERLCQEVLSLPMHSHITTGSIDRVCEAIIQFMEN